MKMRIFAFLFGLLAALEPSLAAQQPGEEKELVIAFAPKDLVLDPLHIYTTMESELATALYEGLLGYHPFSLDPLPAAASRWEVSEDKRTYHFYLRPEALYSNGDPVRAQDFKAAWMRMIRPSSQAEYSFLFDVIRGAKAYRLGGPEAEVGIRALGDLVLEVELEKPASHFLKLLCHSSFAPLNPKYREQKDSDQAPSLVGNGPFYIESRSREELVLAKNKLYWDREAVGLDRIRILFIEDPKEVTAGFNGGRIHWAHNWDASLLEKQAKNKIVFNPLFATNYFFFVCAHSPWNDARVRRALTLLLPWEKIRSPETLFPTSTLIPSIPAYPEAKGITGSQPAQALALLAEAGYPEGKGLPALLIKVGADSESEEVSGLMAQAWKAALGLQVEVRSYPYNEYLGEVKKADFALGTVTWIGDYADPLTFLQMWTRDSNLNDARFSDAEFERLIDEALSETGEARYKILGQAEEILLSQAVVLPVSNAPAFNLIDLDRVEGWFPNVLNIHPFKYLRFHQAGPPKNVVRL